MEGRKRGGEILYLLSSLHTNPEVERCHNKPGTNGKPIFPSGVERNWAWQRNDPAPDDIRLQRVELRLLSSREREREEEILVKGEFHSRGEKEHSRER